MRRLPYPLEALHLKQMPYFRRALLDFYCLRCPLRHVPYLTRLWHALRLLCTRLTYSSRVEGVGHHEYVQGATLAHKEDRNGMTDVVDGPTTPAKTASRLFPATYCTAAVESSPLLPSLWRTANPNAGRSEFSRRRSRAANYCTRAKK